MFRCPLVENRMVIVSRRCGDGGVWESFSEADCGVVNEQLNRLNGTFNNVSQNLSNEMTPPSFPKWNSQSIRWMKICPAQLTLIAFQTEAYGYI